MKLSLLAVGVFLITGLVSSQVRAADISQSDLCKNGQQSIAHLQTIIDSGIKDGSIQGDDIQFFHGTLSELQASQKEICTGIPQPSSADDLNQVMTRAQYLQTISAGLKDGSITAGQAAWFYQHNDAFRN